MGSGFRSQVVGFPYFPLLFFHSATQKTQILVFVFGATAPSGPGPPHSRGFLDHTQRHITVSRTPLEEWSACLRNLCLTVHNTHNRQTSMPPLWFEPIISGGERPQTYALERATTWTGTHSSSTVNKPQSFPQTCCIVHHNLTSFRF
jgi:hypothetical protein